MTIEILVALTILLIMCFIMFFLLKRIVEGVNHNSKEYYMLKLQDYNDLVEKKESEKDKEIIEESVVQQQQQENDSEIKKDEFHVETQPDYQIENFLQLAKQVDEKFNFNVELEIKKFIEEKVDKTANNNYYNSLINIKKIIDKYELYNLITSNKIKKQDVINEINLVDKSVVKKYSINGMKFNYIEFYEFLDNEIHKNDPTIYVEVGEKSMDYSYINKLIKTTYNSNIYKGIIIVYKNNMYDYSLNF